MRRPPPDEWMLAQTIAIQAKIKIRRLATAQVDQILIRSELLQLRRFAMQLEFRTGSEILDVVLIVVGAGQDLPASRYLAAC